MGGKRGQLAILGVRRGDARAVLDIGKVRGKCEPAAPSPATRIANEVSRDAEGVGGVDGVQEYRRDPQEYVSEMSEAQRQALAQEVLRDSGVLPMANADGEDTAGTQAALSS